MDGTNWSLSIYQCYLSHTDLMDQFTIKEIEEAEK